MHQKGQKKEALKEKLVNTLLLTHRQSSSNKSDYNLQKKEKIQPKKRLLLERKDLFDQLCVSFTRELSTTRSSQCQTDALTYQQSVHIPMYARNGTEETLFHLICISHIYVWLRTEETFGEGTDYLRLTNAIYRSTNRVGIRLLNLVPSACRRL